MVLDVLLSSSSSQSLSNTDTRGCRAKTGLDKKLQCAAGSKSPQPLSGGIVILRPLQYTFKSKEEWGLQQELYLKNTLWTVDL